MTWATWATWPLRLIGFLVWFAREVVVSNVAILRDNLTAGQDSTPGIARFRSACRTEAEITALASFVTLTPGTLTLGVIRDGDDQDDGGSSEPWTLVVHGMYADDADALRAVLTDMETRMLRAFRRKGLPS
ncbi:Na+/H+ antiporter subunit E [Agromyces atrinae]|uniref:Na+/H+ antiporter subunit E n=1 Tax=Agromyces atrinae TaxID=592376 RepID=UPI001F5A0CBC|nr:Na+/H+ antiporter subunit E [Agromyces atrinae]MCI2956670.1 Na+/H+ antiporter subunit E [Agromyces atrinae]